MIIINKMKIPIYGIIIIISILIGLLFNYIFLKKNGIKERKTLLYLFLLFVYSFIGGLLFNSIANFDFENYSIGLSSYGGAIGICICSIIFEKIDNSNGKYIKSAILSLPLIYAISKLACFFSGCCYGIPYNGVFSVVYTDGLNISLLPIQLIETIVFMIVFIICYLNNNNKNIIPITMLLSAISKFILDFFRYIHLNEVLSINQVISIIFIIIGISIYFKEKNKNTNTKEPKVI